MFWCLVRLSTGALCGGLYANPLEMAIQSAVACSEVKDDGLLVSCQLMERVLVWVVSFSLAVEDGFLFIMDKSFSVFLIWRRTAGPITALVPVSSDTENINGNEWLRLQNPLPQVRDHITESQST